MGNGRSQSQPTSPVNAPVQPVMSKSEAVKARPAQKAAGEPNPSRDWDEAHFFSELATQAQEPEVQVARQIYNWAKKKTSQIEWSASGSRGFYAPVLSHEGRNCRLFTVTSNGWLELELNRLRVHPPFNDPGKRRELLEQLDAIREITLPEDVLAAKYALALRPFTNPAVLSQFLKVFEWAITEVMLGNGLAGLAFDWSAEPADETGDDLNGNDFSSY